MVKPGRALKAEWIDSEHELQSPPNPAFPNGAHLDFTHGKTPCCRIDLKYPAKRCGLWRITCPLCGLSLGVTTAGRADDPRSVTVPCKVTGG